MVIQRSWKILSESGSTSASSTEANRSPSGLHSSSDDSNCSNQTTHSMVTSVASPPAAKYEMPTSTPSSEAVLIGVASTYVTGVCEPTNRSLQKFVTTSQMAETVLQRLKQRLSCPIAGSGATSESAMRSLELLRISVQSAFDKEIDSVVKGFMESYFKPAFKNLKENLGQNAVSEDTLQKMSCALLENAKAQYNAFRVKTQPNCLSAQASGSEQPVRVAIKRPAAKPIGVNELSKKLFPSAVSQQALTNVTSVKSTLVFSQSALLQTQQQQQTPVAATTPARRQIFWNTANISTTTKFVLDVQANQAFGFSTDGTERLASKHPELIRYLPDIEDREWLTTQNIISQQNKNSRFLFLIHDEVCRLQQTHEAYRTKPNIDLSLMRTFSVPEFMIQKMKLFFVDLNIKSRGLITNSFSMGTTSSHGVNSHLRNALLQGMQTVVTARGSTESNAGVSANNVTTSTSDISAVAHSKPKASTLSSSHATLTALLNNSLCNPNNGAIDKTEAASKLRK